ncbi:MAG: hypothetical protein A2X86_10080 [Bdellovibrionales bacterium GWA2_49_15]|nr:MAG: hypothetical protein A2X86_10080 [Bdellovibrionales bacterium GWA2_49_15]HAZ14235.1 hypothetical protein [Bdellovibrionales bacterium]
MPKYLLILTLTGVLWANLKTNPQPLPKSAHPWEIITSAALEKSVTERLRHMPRRSIALWKAFLWGDTQDLHPRLRLAIRELNLPHLFTPSGLHLWALRLAGSPLELALYSLHPWPHALYQGFLCLFPFAFEGLYALKRMALFHLVLLVLHVWAKRKKKKLDLFIIFLAVFAVDFIFGTYQQGPLSFCLSFLFLGSIFASIPHGKTWIYLIGAQIFLATMQGRPITTMALLISPLVIGQFAILFPAILLAIAWPNTWIIKTTMWGTQAFMHELTFLFALAQKHPYLFPWLFPSITLALAIPLFVSGGPVARRWALVFLLLAPNGVLNHPRKNWALILTHNFSSTSRLALNRHNVLLSSRAGKVPKSCHNIPLEGWYKIECRKAD